MSSKTFISRGLFMLLFLLCTSVLSASATVQLVKKMLNSLNMATFIGVQRYTQPITHKMMVSEAKLALDSLTGGKKTKPAVVSALWAGGNDIFFASSAKGKGTVPGNDDLKIPTPVLDALKSCAADFGKHNYDGKCGEIMVIAEWLLQNPGKSLPKDKVIVAVNEGGVVPPCSARAGGGTYGCSQFLKSMNFDDKEIIDKEPEEEGEACELAPPGSPKGSLGKRACRRPGKAAKGTKKTNAPRPKNAKPSPRKGSARSTSRRPTHKRSIQPRWNGWMAY